MERLQQSTSRQIQIPRNPDQRSEDIKEIVIKDIISSARDAKTNDVLLVLMGHSQGANIIYDILSDSKYRRKFEAELQFELDNYLFISVGTQIGLFEELGLFKKRTDYQNQKPKGCMSWWHFYKDNDVLSFAAMNKKLFIEKNGSHSVDEQINVTEGGDDNILKAHSSYFQIKDSARDLNDPQKMTPFEIELRRLLGIFGNSKN